MKQDKFDCRSHNLDHSQEKKEISKAWGISSLVCGILSILTVLMPYFGLPLGVLALVFSHKDKESGLSMGGKVTGIIGVCLNTITLIIFGVVMLIGISFGL